MSETSVERMEQTPSDSILRISIQHFVQVEDADIAE